MKLTITSQRLYSLDALRGFDMFWIIGAEEIFHKMAEITKSPFWNSLSGQFIHPPWHGFAFYDLIFPLFLFGQDAYPLAFEALDLLDLGGVLHDLAGRRDLLVPVFDPLVVGVLDDPERVGVSLTQSLELGGRELDFLELCRVAKCLEGKVVLQIRKTDSVDFPL